jgi:hypothetical protein
MQKPPLAVFENLGLSVTESRRWLSIDGSHSLTLTNREVQFTSYHAGKFFTPRGAACSGGLTNLLPNNKFAHAIRINLLPINAPLKQ